MHVQDVNTDHVKTLLYLMHVNTDVITLITHFNTDQCTLSCAEEQTQQNHLHG